MKNLLVVYNTCGISGRENTDYYIKAIQALLHQKTEASFDVVLSSCLNSHEQREKIYDYFEDAILYNYIDIKRTVNQSFNDTISKFSEYEGFLYVDSGCMMKDEATIEAMWEYFQTGKYGIVGVATNTDTAFRWCFGRDIIDEPTIVPVGKACNCHVQIFARELFDAFNNKIIPDIFASFSTESTYSFLCAAIEKEWIVLPKPIVEHAHSMDGASSGFGHNYNLLPGARPIHEIINNPEGTECGFGYEECRNVKMHNPEAYNGNKAKYPDRLRKFLLENMYLK